LLKVEDYKAIHLEWSQRLYISTRTGHLPSGPEVLDVSSPPGGCEGIRTDEGCIGVDEEGSHAGLNGPSGWCIGVDDVDGDGADGGWRIFVQVPVKQQLGTHRAMANGSPLLKNGNELRGRNKIRINLLSFPDGISGHGNIVVDAPGLSSNDKDDCTIR
jgi:hypothetical protein